MNRTFPVIWYVRWHVFHNRARGQPVSSRAVLVDLGPQTSAMYSLNMYIILFGRDTQTFLVHTLVCYLD